MESTVKWLQNSKKPLDLKTLGTIEQKVTQHFGGLQFDSLGAGPFLSFIQKKEILPHLGNSVMVSTKGQNELNELLIIKEDIKLFFEQCGDESSQQKVYFCNIISSRPISVNFVSMFQITSNVTFIINHIIMFNFNAIFTSISSIILHHQKYHPRRNFDLD